MAKQVFDSPDLLRLIYSFGDPNHRKFTRNLKRELKSQATEFYYYFQTNRDKYNNIYICLSKHSKREIKEYLKTFKRCFCCTRHSNQMPILSNTMVMMTGPSVFENHTKRCICPCRSLSRDFIEHLMLISLE